MDTARGEWWWVAAVDDPRMKQSIYARFLKMRQDGAMMGQDGAILALWGSSGGFGETLGGLEET